MDRVTPLQTNVSLDVRGNGLRRILRRRRVWRQIDLLNLENVVLGGGTEEQRVVAWNGELFFQSVLRVAAHEAEAARRGAGGKESDTE